MSRHRGRDRGDGLLAAIDRWLDHVFYGGVEVGVLSIPVLVFLLAVPEQSPVSLSALTAFVACTLLVATLRGGWLDLGEWPGRLDVFTLPFRSAYYGGTIALAAYAGVLVDGATGSPVAVVAAAAGIAAAATAAFPRALAGVRGLAGALGRWGIS